MKTVNIENWREEASTVSDSREMNLVAESVRNLAERWELRFSGSPDLADAFLAEAINLWLRLHHPCGDPDCKECETCNTATKRLDDLHQAVDFYAGQSLQLFSVHDIDFGHA